MGDLKAHSRGRDERVVQFEVVHDGGATGIALFALTSHGRLFSAVLDVANEEVLGWQELQGPLIA